MAQSPTRPISEVIRNSKGKIEAVPRINYRDPNLEAAIALYEAGRPLVIEGFHEDPRWPKDLFSLDGFIDKSPDKVLVRSMADFSERYLPVRDYIAHCGQKLDGTSTGSDAEDIYAKDLHCPSEYSHWLHNSGLLPSTLLPDKPENLLLALPTDKRVETLMCYLGMEGTYTAAHKDLCASSGHNLMCHAESHAHSLWYMTEGPDAPHVAEYFNKKFNSDPDLENCRLKDKDFTSASFIVYVTEQRLGDLVLVPPRSMHQVINMGGLTLKTSWSRMTLRGLETALYHELPIYRRVLRPEIYKVKETIYHVLIQRVAEIENFLHSDNSASPTSPSSSSYNLTALQDLAKLFELFDFILETENAGIYQSLIPTSEIPEEPSDLTCDICHADIFQSYFECSDCLKHGEGVIVCVGCFLEGRDCRCCSSRPKQRRPLHRLLKERSRALHIIRQYLNAFGPEALGQQPMQLEESALLKGQDRALFSAALILYRIRQENKSNNIKSRKCHGGREPHEVPPHWLKRCDGCHGGRCLHHLLAKHAMHSMDALFTYEESNAAKNKHEMFHDKHRSKALSQLDQNKVRILQSQETGTSPFLDEKGARYPLSTFLSHICISHYRVQGDKITGKVQAGFYDAPDYQLLDIPLSSSKKPRKLRTSSARPSASPKARDSVTESALLKPLLTSRASTPPSDDELGYPEAIADPPPVTSTPNVALQQGGPSQLRPQSPSHQSFVLDNFSGPSQSGAPGLISSQRSSSLSQHQLHLPPNQERTYSFHTPPSIPTTRIQAGVSTMSEQVPTMRAASTLSAPIGLQYSSACFQPLIFTAAEHPGHSEHTVTRTSSQQPLPTHHPPGLVGLSSKGRLSLQVAGSIPRAPKRATPMKDEGLLTYLLEAARKVSSTEASKNPALITDFMRAVRDPSVKDFIALPLKEQPQQKRRKVELADHTGPQG